MKKKILSIALVACIAITAIAGATLAYFTDEDEATNVFTSGKVDITLNEDFGDQELIPGVRGDENTTLIPGVDINKDVTISLSEDSVESYVWYTYAIPAALDNEDASLNIVHVNHAGRNWLGYQDNQNYWAEGQTKATDVTDCWIIDNKVIETITVDNIEYNVYVVKYNGTLLAGEETTIGMTKVYLDTKVDYENPVYAVDENGEYVVNENGEKVVETKGYYHINGTPINFDLMNVQIIINAYGIQAATFENVEEAYAAYNAQAEDTANNALPVDID